jgi:hypothetical protein
VTIVSDIINLALYDAGIVGVGQTPLAEDSNNAFTRANWMLSLWQRKRWIIWHLVDVAKVSTGAQSYTVTTGGDFNVARPDRLEGGFFRLLTTVAPNQVDYPMRLIESHEDYNLISLKQLGTFPGHAFYDSAYPTGLLYPWPVPQASIYEIHILLKEQLGQFTSLSQTIVLPPEYMAAIHHNLVVRLRSGYQLPADPVQVSLAKESLNVIRGANAQIPTLQMPRELVRNGVYNILSDQFD